MKHDVPLPRWSVLIVLLAVVVVVGLVFLRMGMERKPGFRWHDSKRKADWLSVVGKLERSDGVILLSLDPDDPSPAPTETSKLFHGQVVLGRTELKERTIKRKLLQGVSRSVFDSGPANKSAANPRHGLTPNPPGSGPELVVCFESGDLHVYSGSSHVQYMITTNLAALFNELLIQAGVPLPPR